MSKWIICLFAVAGGFIACGIGGAVISSFLGLWELPTSGFCAAFAVVALSYVSAPAHNKAAAVISFAIGAVIAWKVLEPSFFPEAYEGLAYQKTYIPIVSTLTGGLLALAIIFVRFPSK